MLKGMINGHLTGKKVSSCFSSWAANLQTAIGFAKVHYYDGTHIAIVDTNILVNNVKIYHVNALYKAGLASYAYSEEYLAYGPITGPAYHCVKFADIERKGMSLSTYNPNYHMTSLSTLNTTGVGKFISKAKDVATLFRRCKDKQPDVIIVLVAMLTGYCFPNDSHKNIELFIDAILDPLSRELKEFKFPADETDWKLGLVNPDTYVIGYPQLAWAVKALVALQEHLTSSA